MRQFDKEYLKLCKTILTEGVEVENRTGINSIKISDYNFRFDVGKEFPVLSTKQLFFKNAITEMLWIWQVQSNDVRWLKERNNPIWNEWMIDADGIYRIYEPSGEYDPDKEVIVLDPLSVPVNRPNDPLKPKYDKDGNLMKAKSLIPGKTIKFAKYYGEEYAYTIGTAYGFITKRYEHTQNLQYTLKNDVNDRRQVKSLWQDEFLRTAVLPSCVWSTEWDVTDGKLTLLVHQRSCDVPLGLPFNVTQYAAFLKMMAQVTNLEPGILSWSIKDAHIYVNQVEGIKEQLRREERYNELKDKKYEELENLQELNNKKLENLDKKSKEYQLLDTDNRIIDIILNPETPELVLNEEIDDFFKFDNSKELKDSKIRNYKHMGKINFPIAQ